MISITGRQKRDGDLDEIQLTTKGNLYKKDGGIYLKYDESAATGFAGSSTTLKIDAAKSCVTMIRSGTTKSHLIIEKGRRNICRFDTGYGEMMIGIFGGEIVSSLTENGGDLAFSYSMDINTDLESENEIRIQVDACSS